MPRFERYIGIDYSGAETADSSLKGLRVYAGDWLASAQEVPPPPSPRKYWTRRGLAEWLADKLAGPKPVIVGVDHGFCFPLLYFQRHELTPDYGAFLDDFHKHWPTDAPNMYVDFIRSGIRGAGALREGDPSWFRLTERWTPSAKSVFQFDVQGQVATSTHAGLPWLRYLRQHCPELHFWPFDGWEIPTGKSVIAEAYPSLWMRRFPKEDRDADQHAAYATAEWLREMDLREALPRYFDPPLAPGERRVASVERWILGVV